SMLSRSGATTKVIVEACCRATEQMRLLGPLCVNSSSPNLSRLRRYLMHGSCMPDTSKWHRTEPLQSSIKEEVEKKKKKNMNIREAFDSKGEFPSRSDVPFLLSGTTVELL